MDEPTIRRLYVEKPDEEVRLLCSYTTRREGFLDLLLSGSLRSSEEVKRLLGAVKTHRGSSMTQGGIESSFDANQSISFSTGFVSYKYSDPSLITREDYVGGLGVLVPLKKILEYPHLRFSHCRHVGGIENYNLNKDNIGPAAHKARKEGALHDDGFGNLFEVILCPELGTGGSSLSPEVISYPKLTLSEEVIVAIPEGEREKIVRAVIERQEGYKKFLDKISSQGPEERLPSEIIEGRDMFYVKHMMPFMEKMIRPFNVDHLPIRWYKDRNLDLALQHLAIS